MMTKLPHYEKIVSADNHVMEHYVLVQKEIGICRQKNIVGKI